MIVDKLLWHYAGSKVLRITLNTAKEYYVSEKYRAGPYTTPMDKIYLEDIEMELNDALSDL